MANKNSKQRSKNSYLDPAGQKQRRLDRAAPNTQPSNTNSTSTSRRQPPVPRKGNRQKPS